MKLNFKHFKKKHEDDKKAVLQHPDGHEIHVAKHVLNDKLKKQLAELPMAEGGTVQAAPSPDPQKARDFKKGFEAGGPSIKEMGENLKKAFGYADGGQVANLKENYKKPNVTHETGEQDERTFNQMLQIGKHSTYKAEPPVIPEPKMYAEGGDVEQPKLDLKTEPVVTVENPIPFDTSDIKLTENKRLPEIPMQPTAMPQQAQPVSNVNITPNKIGAPDTMPVQPMQMPQRGINEQIGALRSQAKAEGELGKQQAAAYQSHEDASQKLLEQTQAEMQQISQHRQAVMHDLENGHIDPNHWWNSKTTGGKITTAIGMILGGLGGANVEGFIKRQQEADYNAQVANLNNKKNVLAALQEQFGNLRDAASMYHVIGNDILANKIAKAAALSADPMAKARAQQAIGVLHQQNDLMQQQIAIRQTLGKAVQNGAVPPEQAVQYMVPKEHQKEVFEEIGRAENARKNEHVILDMFDKAANENTVLKTGAGLLREPASVIGMKNMMLPLIKDLEGRVNEYEFETTKKLLPAPGDTDEKIAQKREALQQFLQQKQATPVATGFGISIQKPAAPGIRPNPNAPKRK